MRIEQTVEVDAPAKQVWEFVNDVPRVAPCMPGAKLTKVVDERTYEGTVVVKLGPIRMTYKGTVVMEDLEEDGYTAKMSASGRDVKGAGTARAQVEARLEPVSDEVTRIHVTSDVQLTGKVASFGRGAVQDVAAKLFGQFADNLRGSLHNEPAAGQPAAPQTATETSTGTTTDAATGTAPSGSASGTATSPATGTATGTATGAATTDAPANPPNSAQPAPAARPAPSDAEPKPLEAGGLIGTVISGRAKALVETLGAFARGVRIRIRERR